MKRIDLTGRQFESLTVLELSEQRDSAGARMWKCACCCGGVTYASSNKLLSGKKKSCGCMQRRPRRSPPKTDCLCYRDNSPDGCAGLIEMLCVTRGSCKFYKSKFAPKEPEPARKGIK